MLIFVRTDCPISNRYAPTIQKLSSNYSRKPGDAQAEANLGAALGELGKTQEAIRHFERALQLNPQNVLAKENLGVLRQKP